MKKHEHHEALINGLSKELKPIFEKSEQAIYLYLDDIHKSCNKKFAELLGYHSPEQWAKTTEPLTKAFVEPASQKTLVSAFQKAMKKCVGSKIKVVWKKKTGKPVKTGVILIPIRYKGHLFALHFVSSH